MFSQADVWPPLMGCGHLGDVLLGGFVCLGARFRAVPVLVGGVLGLLSWIRGCFVSGWYDPPSPSLLESDLGGEIFRVGRYTPLYFTGRFMSLGSVVHGLKKGEVSGLTSLSQRGFRYWMEWLLLLSLAVWSLLLKNYYMLFTDSFNIFG